MAGALLRRVWCLLDRACAAIAVADADGVDHVIDEDLAVADLAMRAAFAKVSSTSSRRSAGITISSLILARRSTLYS